MNRVREVQRINERELSAGGEYSDTASWHYQYRDTSWIYVGNMPFNLTEGDIICIFSQYGEIFNIELIRDKYDGKSKGFAFLQYEDQRSAVLAVDNLNGSDILGRTIRVDHSYGPKPQRKKVGDEWIEEPYIPKNNCAPPTIEQDAPESTSEPEEDGLPPGFDPEDPMAAYFASKAKDRKRKKEKKDKKEKKHKKHKSDKRSP
ncbi:hypothetical protein BCR43DRAFT_495942 [Syncephalastrum racemosum]|uniref:RRM domain-containing protein n=1 Tax=Syncephalastrum racemosum TaxID=13706 RepID=A0A1X2H6X5_SYNRA|nr:hypothetical protein BCR43DRAFT_495942 [Syncephalastrum racemosum]